MPENNEIEINFVQHKHRVDVDMSKLTWGDVRKMQTYQAKIASGEMNEGDASEVLTELVSKVTGQNADDLPSTVVQRVVSAMFDGSALNGNSGN